MTRGDQLTVAHLLSYFRARGHQVDLFTLATGGKVNAAQQQWLELSCRQLNIFDHGPWTILRGLGKALVKGLPFQVGYFSNAKLFDRVDAAVKEGEYDIVYNYYLRTASAVPAIFAPNRLAETRGKSIAGFLALQLSQSLNTRRIYENERSWVKKRFYRIECNRVQRYEATIWQQYTKTVLIGPRDVDDIRSVCRSLGQPEISNSVLAAHGTDVERFRPARADEVVRGRIVFSGSMRYQPNVQAAQWFVDNCWNVIRERVPGAELFIVGQSPAASIRALHGRNGIHVTGTVEDVGDYIRRAAVCINPMRAAGGMQNKLIEYMASGKAIVATSIANEGIGAPLDAFELADDATTFTERTIELLESPAKAAQLGKAARNYVVGDWTWEAQFKKLEGAFYSALTSCPLSD
jgi:glycosyltransferase involved in cell wall biosynthesis